MRGEADPRRLVAVSRGRVGELQAAAWLLLTGHRILARRWSSGRAEVDIIARRGHCLMFVEVKARPTEEEARLALRPQQRERIRAAADFWRMTHPRHADCDVRFDMILVSPGRWPRHIRGAFD